MNEEESLEKLVMVIEDDPDMQSLYQLYLSKLKIHTYSLTKGKAFLQEVLNRKPDLICLDLNLPDASGFDICTTLRLHPLISKTPILVVSSRDLPTDEAHAIKAGANAYLMKPFTRSQFSDEVKRLLKL